MKYFIIIDMQVDFTTGALANPDAVAIIPKIVEMAKQKKAEGYTILATRDTHSVDYLETQEGDNLPVEHCICGTKGWEVVDEIKPFVDEYVDKISFGFCDWGNWFDNGDIKDYPEAIEMCGTCTAICVASNFSILKATYPEIPITIHKDLCACVTKDSHEAAIKTMQMQQAIIK